MGNTAFNEAKLDEVAIKKHNRKVNFVFGLIEFITVACYLIFGVGAVIESFMEFDFVGMFEDVFVAILTLTIITFIYSVIFISIKSLRTPLVKRTVIWNFIWIAFNIYGMIG